MAIYTLPHLNWDDELNSVLRVAKEGDVIIVLNHIQEEIAWARIHAYYSDKRLTVVLSNSSRNPIGRKT